MSAKTTMTMRVPDGQGGHIETGPFTAADLKRVTEDIRRSQGKPPMKHDPDFAASADHAYDVTAEVLRQFVERYEHLDAERKDITDQMKEVMSEAKGRGYDTRALKKIIALRKRKPDEIAEEEAVLDLYKAALGMA